MVGSPSEGDRHGRPERALRGDRLRRPRHRARHGVERVRRARVPGAARPRAGGCVQATGITRAYPDLPIDRAGRRRATTDWEPMPTTRAGTKSRSTRWRGPAVTTRTRVWSTWTPRASTSRCSTRRRCSRGSRRPTCSARRAARTTTGCTTTARPTPTRLYGVAVVPLQDIDAAIAEMRRCRRPTSVRRR